MSSWSADLRVAARSLRRDPGFAWTAILALGIGIGLATTAFSIVWGTVLEGLPFDNPRELVHFERADDERDNLTAVPHDLVEWREANRTFVDLAAYTEAIVTLERADGHVERVEGSRIEPRAFPLLGAAPALGRLLADADDQPGAAPVVVLSHGLWQRRFAGASDVLGRSLRLNGEPHTVVGVMPPGFGFPLAEEFWVPLRLDWTRIARGEGRIDVFGRMRPGVDIATARADFDRVSDAVAQRYPETNAGIRAVLRPYTEEYVTDEFAALVIALLVAAALVLTLATLNVANLMLARGARRVREMAVRISLGAGGGRILRHLFAEAAVLAIGAAAVGVALAWVGVSWFAGRGGREGTFELAHGTGIPFWWDISLDPASLAFVVVVTTGTVLLTGLLPAAQALRADPNRWLRSEGRGGSGRASRVLRGVLVAEIAVAGGVLTVSGLMGRSVASLSQVGQALDLDDVVVATVSLPDARLGADESSFPTVAARLQFWDQVSNGLAAQPGIQEVAIATGVPFVASRHQEVEIPGREQADELNVASVAVSPGYFGLLGVAPHEGRVFGPQDVVGAPHAVIVNRSFALTWYEGSALGRVVRVPGSNGEMVPARIVGVVPDLWADGIGDREPQAIYRALAQSAGVNRAGVFDRRELRQARVMVRAGTVGSAPAVLREVIGALGTGIPIDRITTMERIRAQVGGEYRLYGTAYLVMGVVSLLMVLIGLYGLVSYTVRQQEREIGIRVALGAESRSVLRLVLGRALAWIGMGLAGGLAIALWLRSAVQLVLYQVEPTDPSVLGIVFTVLALTTVAAAGLPAWRASRLDPRVSMRADR